MTILLWLILAVICWPLALVVLVLYVGITVNAVFGLLKAILGFPARVLRGR